MMYILTSSAALLTGFIIDLILGDPQGWPHIVRAFGALIAFLEKLLYQMKNKRLAGTILAVSVLLTSLLVPAALLTAAWIISPLLYFALETLLVWQLIAVRSLRAESRRVYDELERNDICAARKAVSMIVGRDTDALDKKGVTKAAVETVAENASDGVAAPLFFIMLGGAALGCFYKAANTMDSMIGYKSEKYIDFGRFAAKLDDVLNFIPSRLCALVMIISSPLCSLDAKGAYRIWRRDRRNHESPNSAQTEAVMAGALRVRLAGNAYYFGKLHEKLFIGDDLRPIASDDILKAHRLLYVTSSILVLLALIFRGFLYAAL